MEGKTHYIGGSIGAIVGFIMLKEHGMLLDNVNPAIQFSVMYPFAIYGGMLPDADHHPESSPLHDPIGRVFNRALHIFNKPYELLDNTLSESHKRNNLPYKLLKILKCTHRSWQTHSELTLGLLVYLLYKLLSSGTNSPNTLFLVLMIAGLTLGIISHLILDLMTMDGINFAIGFIIKTLFPNVPMITKIRIVPYSHMFGTGSLYELNVRSVLNIVQYFLLGYAVLVMFGYSLTMI